MTDTTNGYRALPWRSEGYRVFDADGIEVANTFTPELALGSAKAVAKDIVESANAHYGDKDARIAELERQTKEAGRNAEWAINRMVKAEARVRELEGRLERATWEYGVLDYDRRMDLAKAGAGSAAFLDDEYDDYPVSTFTAPDGRVFREGQRVYDVIVNEYARVAKAPGGAFPVELQWEDRGVLEPLHADHIGDLRRVWDGSEEPDVPVGTVLRDSYGCYLERLSGARWEPRWELRDEKGDPVDNDEWVNLDGEQFRPYVEVLPGDDE